MSTVIIIGPAHPLRGGIAESNHALYQSFHSIGQDAEIISYSLQYPHILFPGRKQTLDCEMPINTSITSIINTLNPFSWLKAANYIINKNPNYVIVRYWHPYFSICLSVILSLLRKKSILVIGWIDNVKPHESIPFQRIITSFFVNSCDAFLVMSRVVKNDLLEYSSAKNKKIIVSPHPIYNVFGKSIPKHIARKNLGLSYPGNNKNQKYILFFGLIRKYKGLDLLLEIMSSPRIQKLNIKLIIAGEFYHSKDQYINMIKVLNIHNSVILHDYYIPNHDVVNYFCASDLVVQPYVSATQSGVSMIAYNFNKPMVLTNVGGLSEYVSNGLDGYLVDVNKESIILALEDYYMNNRENMFVDAIKKKKLNYSWERLVKKFSNLYKECT